jgi:hypothetical protein
VLASATSNHQYIHDGINNLSRINKLGVCFRTGDNAGSFVDDGRALGLESAFTCDSLAYSVGLQGPHRAPARSVHSGNRVPEQ